MNNFFDKKTIEDYWSSVVIAADKYCADSLNEDLAFECAIKLWHMCDWYFKEHEKKLNYKQLSELQGAFCRLCPNLRVMRDLCNFMKHRSLEKTNNPVIRKASRHDGPFSSEFSREFDVSVLEIELEDGTKVYLDEAVEDVVTFWQIKIKTDT